MADSEEPWFPLVDEAIGSIVERIEKENADVAALVESPHRLLAFRAFTREHLGS